MMKMMLGRSAAEAGAQNPEPRQRRRSEIADFMVNQVVLDFFFLHVRPGLFWSVRLGWKERVIPESTYEVTGSHETSWFSRHI
jgi:hypothetical protein